MKVFLVEQKGPGDTMRQWCCADLRHAYKVILDNGKGSLNLWYDKGRGGREKKLTYTRLVNQYHKRGLDNLYVNVVDHCEIFDIKEFELIGGN